MEWFEVALWSTFLCAFSIWFTILSKKLSDALDDIGITDDKIDDIEDSIQLVAQILSRLPEMTPNFHMNNNPLTPIIEMITQRMQQGSRTGQQLRGNDGRFQDGTAQEEIPQKGQGD